ncbi:hypothetical protein L8W59_08350, partial [Campylobacter lari]|nr:hypothetical protein [Campylobacter lari]
VFEMLQGLSKEEIERKNIEIEKTLREVTDHSILKEIQHLHKAVKDISTYILSASHMLDLNFSKILEINKKIHDFKILFEKNFSLLGEILVPALKDIEIKLANIYLTPAISQEDKKTRMILWILKQEEWFEILQSTLINFYSAISKENK